MKKHKFTIVIGVLAHIAQKMTAQLAKKWIVIGDLKDIINKLDVIEPYKTLHSIIKK